MIVHKNSVVYFISEKHQAVRFPFIDAHSNILLCQTRGTASFLPTARIYGLGYAAANTSPFYAYVLDQCHPSVIHYKGDHPQGFAQSV